MEKVVVSLGGSVLVPGDDAARYLRDVARLFRDVSSRVKLFVVTGGGRVARYYIETGRSVGIRERSLDEFGIAVTRLNARLLSAALGGRANREPATSYAAASKLAKRYPIVVMGGTRPGHTTDRVAASLARFVGAHRIVNATSVDGVYSADPKKDPGARLVPRMRFGDLVTLSGKGHRTAGPSVVFDPVAARVVARDRTPLSVVHGRDLRALRAALLGEPFHGTRVTDEQVEAPREPADVVRAARGRCPRPLPRQRHPCGRRSCSSTNPRGRGLVTVRGRLPGTRSLLPRIFESSALPRSRALAYGCFRAEPRS